MKLDGNNRLIWNNEAEAQLRAVQREFLDTDWATAPRELRWWTIPANYRGCEVAVLTKIDALMRAGVPAAPLMFTVVETPEGAYHTLLCVMTHRGDFVLTCHADDVVTLESLREQGYRVRYRTAVGGTLASVEQAIEQYR